MGGIMERILIVDDEKEIIELLSLYLEQKGYEIIEAYDGLDAWQKIQNEKVDLAIIDVMMPKMDGFNLVKKIRSIYPFPVIMLSAKHEDVDKILGLGLGADDYMAKPFNPLEVVARVDAQLRRKNMYHIDDEPKYIKIDPYVLDIEGCMLKKEGKEISLTSTEYKILELLMSHPGKVFTRSQIFEHVWSEFSDGDDLTIMVHIRKIREKIEDHPSEPKYLKTIRGLGYRFEKQG